MKLITSIEEMKKSSCSARCENKVIGFVPTMGYLHDGHLSLIKASVQECDYTVVSIFVNPTQFGPGEDLESYPRNLEADKELLQAAGIDVLFYPHQKDLYPDSFQTTIKVEEKTKYLCGKSRPSFFQGVTTVVLKLFNILNPHRAFFGEKDWQQLEVIRTMVRDLNIGVVIVGKPTIRESDGLAMSSRNKYLSGEDRAIALSLSQALKSAQKSIMEGESSAENIRAEIREIIEKKNNAEIDYISICDPESFKEQNKICMRTLIALAVWVDKARLIDNLIIERI